MNTEQIEKGLLAKFAKSRLVFWQDAEGEFSAVLDDLALEGVVVLKVDGASQLAIKQQIEFLQPSQAFLIYSTQPAPDVYRDWLYDIRLYSEHFYADASSLVLNELGMRMEFRQLIAKYKSFFKSKQRLSKLKRLLPANANKEELELSMLAVALKVDNPSMLGIVLQLMQEFATAQSDSVLAELEKLELLPPLRSLLAQEFGYLGESNEPSLNLNDLLKKLLLTDFYQGLVASGYDGDQKNLGYKISQHILPQQEGGVAEAKRSYQAHSSKRAAVLNFVASWRENRLLNQSYNQLAHDVAEVIDIRQLLAEFTDSKDPSDRMQPGLLAKADTFEDIEKAIISMLAKQLPAFYLNEVENLISRRLTGHWCYANPIYSSIYKAIRAARQFYEIRTQYLGGFTFATASQLLDVYKENLYKFDACYRQFHEHAAAVAQHGSDILKLTGLAEDIEALYVDWYLHDLAVNWGNCIDAEQLIDHWRIQGTHSQSTFYQREVRSLLNNSQSKRVFVIISDALRYEVAHELMSEINNEQRFKAALSTQLGVLPSYTQLGMAALLPHQVLSAKVNSSIEYLCDGVSAHGLENRQKVLAKHKGIAVKAEDVLNWTNQEGRDIVKDAEIVYIYHDTIDAIGDKQATEQNTFQACRTAINDIKNLVARIINRLNGSRVVVTADHGFLFKATDVTEQDKTSLKVQPAGAVLAKKRYVMGTKLPSADHYWKGSLSKTANVTASDEDIEFLIPRGSNRFHFVGGARFVHGGAMPQEVCVPVLHVRELDTKAQTKHAKQKVNVVPLNSPLRLVSNIDRLTFLQTDMVGDSFKARELAVWIEDPEHNIVSSKEKLMFDAAAEKMEDRRVSTQITLRGTGFNRNIAYRLVLEDTESKSVYATHGVTIDLAFEDDFF